MSECCCCFERVILTVHVCILLLQKCNFGKMIVRFWLQRCLSPSVLSCVEFCHSEPKSTTKCVSNRKKTLLTLRWKKEFSLFKFIMLTMCIFVYESVCTVVNGLCIISSFWSFFSRSVDAPLYLWATAVTERSECESPPRFKVTLQATC